MIFKTVAKYVQYGCHDYSLALKIFSESDAEFIGNFQEAHSYSRSF